MVKPVCSAASRLVLLMALGITGCDSSFDARRTESAPDSLGHVLYANLCERIAAAAYPDDVSGRGTRAVCHTGMAPAADSAPKLRAFHAERDRFVHAVDAMMASDPELARDLRGYLVALLPAYDDGSMAAQVHKVVHVLQSWRSTPAVARAVAAWGLHADPTPTAAPALAESLLTYPRLQEVLGAVAHALAPQGPGHAALLQLEQALHGELSDPALRGAHHDFWAALRAFLVSSLPEGLAQPQSRWVLARDGRGVPQVACGSDRTLPPPFVPATGKEGDPIAAIDDSGRFVDAAGRPLTLAAWGAPSTPGFDAAGRAVDAAGRLRFVYHDAGTSVLAGLLAQLQQVLDREPALLTRSISALRAAMGQEHARTHRVAAAGKTVAWRGFDANTAPLASVAHTLGWLAQQPHLLPAVTTLAEALWRDQEPALAAGLHMGWQLADWAQEPSTRSLTLRPGNTALDDFIDLGVEIAKEEGLLEDIQAALQDPATQPLGDIVALHMTTRDFIDYSRGPDYEEGGQLDCNGEPTGDFVTPVDRTSTDPNLHRSVMERLLHVVHDAQQTVCSVGRPDLQQPDCFNFQIDDAAMFYLQSVVGDARFVLRMAHDDPAFEAYLSPEMMAALSGIDGYTDPEEITEGCAPNPLTGEASRCAAFKVTPQAAARMFFVPFDARLENDRLALLEGMVREPTVAGQGVSKLHHSTLFAWELHGFHDAVRPLLKAFAKHHREDLVLRLLNVMHKHWARGDNGIPELLGRMQPWQRSHTGLSQFEPLMARLLTEARFAQVAADFINAAQAVQVGRVNGAQVLASTTRQLLHAPGFSTETRLQPITRGDGTSVAAPSPLHALRHALHEMGHGLSEDAGGAGLLAPVGHAFLPVTCAGGACALRNREAHALVGAGLGFAREQVQRRVDIGVPDGGMQAVGESLAQAVLNGVESPVLGSVVQMLAHGAEHTEAAAEIDALLGAMLGAQSERAADLATVLLATTRQPDAVPVLATALAPLTGGLGDGGLASAQLQVLAHAVAADDRRVLSRLLTGLNAPAEEGVPALGVLANVFAQVNRAAPGTPGPLLAHDYDRGLWATLEEFLQDHRHGLVRLLDVIAQRAVSPSVAPAMAPAVKGSPS